MAFIASIKVSLQRLGPWRLGLALIPISALLAWLTFPTQPEVTQAPPQEQPWSLDTFIPSGMTLVPIQIHNSENLDSMVGRFAIVDVYLSSVTQRLDRPILRQVKLLRAPRNPEQFGLLVSYDEAGQVVGLKEPVHLAIRNPVSPGIKTENATRVRKARSRILREDD